MTGDPLVLAITKDWPASIVIAKRRGSRFPRLHTRPYHNRPTQGRRQSTDLRTPPAPYGRGALAEHPPLGLRMA